MKNTIIDNIEEISYHTNINIHTLGIYLIFSNTLGIYLIFSNYF